MIVTANDRIRRRSLTGKRIICGNSVLEWEGPLEAYRIVIEAVKENAVLAIIAGMLFLIYGLTEIRKGEALRFICVCAALVVGVPLIGLIMSAIQLMTTADWHISLGY